MKFTIIKSCLARFSGIFALGTPSNIHGTAISYRCTKFGAFVNSVTILTLRDLTKEVLAAKGAFFYARDQITFCAFHSFLVEVQTSAILVPRATRLVSRPRDQETTSSGDENDRMLATYMPRMLNNYLEIRIAGSFLMSTM